MKDEGALPGSSAVPMPSGFSDSNESNEKRYFSEPSFCVNFNFELIHLFLSLFAST